MAPVGRLRLARPIAGVERAVVVLKNKAGALANCCIHGRRSSVDQHLQSPKATTVLLAVPPVAVPLVMVDGGVEVPQERNHVRESVGMFGSKEDA